MSQLFSLTRHDFIKGALMVFITTTTTTIGGSVITILNQLVESLKSGSLSFDLHAILSSILSSILIGFIMGLIAGVNYLLKNFVTDKTSSGAEFLGGRYKI